ncbi:hypothetical protein SKAU_G00210220 [Synaphobranchus kaupii]|uniref:Uncharacterized protein n=1 Tax=Synaphobranchus kaupii TaxID=118154 RepID=A0A9Q1F8V6_SYNKA|nr:hypothetical protein SKAU_G00210220 [Synaphobranchus kaupii]
MMRLYSFYRRSTKKWKELKAVADILEEHVVKPARSQGTRWIDHRRKALTSLATNYHSIVTHFQELASGEWQDIQAADRAKVKAYLKQMTSFKFIMYMYLYQDLVADLADLSLQFQQDEPEIPISLVRSKVNAAKTGLQKQTQSPGPNLRPVLKEQRKEIVSSISYYIGVCFSTFSDDPVLLAAEVFDPVNFPTDNTALLDYGT